MVSLAEAQGFEPWNPLGLPVFKTGAFDRSAKLPVGERQVYRIRWYFANQASQKNLPSSQCQPCGRS